MSDETHAHLTGAGQYDCAPEPLPTLRHSTAHLLAQAVTQLFPGVKLAIGPPIENGFYYDFHRDVPFTEEDLGRLEERMRDLAKADYPIVREERSRAEAIRYYREHDEPFKVEILEALPPDVTRVSFYRQGDFVDLCRGPHVPSTGHIQAFKLLSSSGAYWRGDEHRPMLQRIYGTAWFTQEELDKYVWSVEEAKRRDHRKLGRELDLIMFHDVSPGAPFWLPKGMVVFRELERYARELQDARGYQEISTPILVNKRLWEQSGHWEHYSENMFKVEAEEQIFSLKPMNCPESTYAYRHALRSYRDLPLRFSEMGRLHRNERSGTLTGLFRVRQITMDDAHIYCRPDQLQAEIAGVLELVEVFYGTFGIKPTFKLATRPDKYLGTAEQWDHAERALEEALRANGLAVHAQAGRRGVLRPQDRHPHRGCPRARLADGHRSGGPDHAARSLPARVHRRGQPGEAADRDPPGDPRLVRALHRHPDRALRGRLPDVAGAGPGAGPPGLGQARRVRRHGPPAPARCRRAGRARRPLGEARVQGARGAGPEGAVRAGGGGARGPRGHRERSQERRRGRRGDARRPVPRRGHGRDPDPGRDFTHRAGTGVRRISTLQRDLRINEGIRAREVRVVSAEGEQLGILPIAEALRIAQERELDLVEVAPEAVPPVCRIMDFGKFKYQQSRRAKDARKKQTVIQVKEVKMGPKTDEHDFQFKARHVRRFIEDGNKAKVTIRFRGREMVHTELGRRLLDRMTQDMLDIATIESHARLEGRNMVMILTPKQR